MLRILILIFFIMNIVSIYADTSQTQDPTYRSFGISLGNDAFAIQTTDQYLTNTIRIELETNQVPEFINKLFSDHHNLVNYKIAQNMYTPEDIDSAPIDGHDHPYAGWLYLEISLLTKKSKSNQMDILGARIGVVGPYAFAGETQKIIHGIIGSRQPTYWDQQLDNELAIDIFYRKVFSLRKEYPNFTIEALPYFNATVGNVHTDLSLGSILRFGYNIPNDMGQTTFDSNYDIKEQQNKNDIRFYGFTKGESTLVARDIFLDGNTFTSDPRALDKYPLRYQLSTGVVTGYKNVDVVFSYNYNSKRFTTQNDAHQSATIMLKIKF